MKPYTVITVCAIPLLISGLLSGCNRSPPDPTLPAVATTTVGTEIDDSIITGRVKAALLNNSYVKSLDIKVETRKGEVQLSGFVDNQFQVDHASKTVLAVPGVKNIDDKLIFKASKTSIGNKIDDNMITAKVKTVLLADLRLKSLDIGVVTRKGDVMLSGFVDSQKTIDYAVVVVDTVEGVQRVVNEMSIKK